MIAFKTWSLALLGFALALCMVSQDRPVVVEAEAPAIRPAPALWEAHQLETRLGSDGFVCTDEPTLTDTVIFAYDGGHAAVVTFDTAYAAASARQGTVEAYCTASSS